ncbi:hypothetical protein G6L37_34940 [Agrobacterium rubi]|nr:hypothetical protein [Agrobacterium rubi]NTF23766.1 hypothetical protein [Agrobacterium rubi]
MMFILYIALAIICLIVLPFSHIVGIGIFSALLFWAFHVHPAAVFGLYLVAYVLRSILVLAGLVGAVSWFGRKKGSTKE